MKILKLIFCLLGLIFFAITGKAQDSTYNKLCKTSISVGGGMNITYPAITQYYDNYGGLIVPSSSIQSWEDLSYNVNLKQTQHSSLGICFGIGYIQYQYDGTTYSNNMYYKNNPIQSLQKVDEVEINIGFFSNINIIGKISWFNEIGLLGAINSWRLFPVGLFGPNAIWAYDPQVLYDLTNEENASIFLFYQTGITIKINKKLAITPMVEFLLCNITDRSYTWNYIFGNYIPYESISAFNSLRTGLIITYNFYKK